MCDQKVIVGTTQNGSPIIRKCGEWWAGYQAFCRACEKRLSKRYPQGWCYTPGDLCKHGKYVGGCMADYICPQCENGE